MKKIWTASGCTLVAAALIGCGGGGASGGGAKSGGIGKDSAGHAVSAAAANKLKQGLDMMTQHDRANDWTEATCKATADVFISASKETDHPFVEAIYDAGLAYQRCKMHAEAKAQFSAALSKDPKFHRARVQMALYNFADSGERNVDAAIADLNQAVLDAQFQNPEALVNLAMMQMRRNSDAGDSDGANDFERAKKNLQRALAVDDGFMPAFNQLAIYYLQTAKQKAGRQIGRRTSTNAGKEKRIDTQAAELAALVCSQAVKKNAKYAPIHNTAGMIHVELGNLNSAVKEFDAARKIDPTFYEAQMNYAAVNLQFRGFKPAEEAFRAALRMRPNDYDAHLGLALALRGQIGTEGNPDALIKGSSDELAAAKKIAPDRPETYYNEGILTQEFKAKSGGAGAEKSLNDAKGLYGQFIQKAGSSPEFADAVKRSNERMAEIDQIISFNRQTEAERKAAEADMKNKAAEAEVKAGEETEGGTAPQGGGDDKGGGKKP